MRGRSYLVERTEIANGNNEANSLGDVMEDGHSPWEKTFYHRLIQTKIGEVLRVEYDQKHKPLPHKFLTVLMQLDEKRNVDVAKDPSRTRRLTKRGLSDANMMRRLRG